MFSGDFEGANESSSRSHMTNHYVQATREKFRKKVTAYYAEHEA